MSSRPPLRYIKVDWCNTSGLDPQTQYTKIHTALVNSGRAIVLALCDWGVNSPWIWGSSPLITGNDLASMSSTTASILTNTDVIAVDQDAAGIQGTKVADNGAGLQVWAKKLQGSNTYAVALLNRNSSASNITVNWSTLGLAGSASVRDLWAHTNVGSFTSSYTANVPAPTAR